VDVDRAGFLHGAAEGEGLRDIVGFIFQQGLFDEEVEVTLGKAEAAVGFQRVGEEGGDGVGDVGNELAVDVGEDGFLVLVAGDEEIGKGVTNGVGDVFKRELGVGGAAGDGDVGDRLAFLGGGGFATIVTAAG